MLSKYGKVAVTEIAFYAPLFLANTAIGKTRSFDRRTAWIYLEILAIIRLIGASVQLESEKSPRKSLITVAAIASSVGIAPLLLFMNWHLRRINASLAAPRNVSHYIFGGVYAGVVVAVILAIIGGATATYSPDEPFHAKIPSKIAITMLIAIFVGLIAVNMIVLFRLRYVPRDERIPLLAVTAGIPFFTSRLVYSCIAAYVSSRTFNPVGGSVWVMALMSVLEEFIVVIVYFVACIKTPRVDTEAKKPGETHESEGSIRGVESLDNAASQTSGESVKARDGPEEKASKQSKTEDAGANTSLADLKADSSSRTTICDSDKSEAGTGFNPIKNSEVDKTTIDAPLQRQRETFGPETQLDADIKSYPDAGKPFDEENSPDDKYSTLSPHTKSERSRSETQPSQDSSLALCGNCKGRLDVKDAR